MLGDQNQMSFLIRLVRTKRSVSVSPGPHGWRTTGAQPASGLTAALEPRAQQVTAP